MSDRNNENLKRIIGALGLGALEVREILGHGGIVTSREHAQRMLRGAASTSGRYVVMTDDEFDAFCEGLVRWSKTLPEKP